MNCKLRGLVDSNEKRRITAKIKYEGMIFSNSDGYEFIIAEYNNAFDVNITFIKTGFKSNIEISQAKKGNVQDYSIPSVCSVGILGRRMIKGCDLTIVNVWRGMIYRVYCESYLKTNASYRGVEVCADWLYFEIFEKWYHDNYPESDDIEMQLDKDLLSGDRKIYSPETCCFLPEELNLLFRRNIKKDKAKIILAANKYRDSITVSTYSALINYKID
jgi:hypothetical protein